jgi:hypothetical protein
MLYRIWEHLSCCWSVWSVALPVVLILTCIQYSHTSFLAILCFLECTNIDHAENSVLHYAWAYWFYALWTIVHIIVHILYYLGYSIRHSAMYRDRKKIKFPTKYYIWIWKQQAQEINGSLWVIFRPFELVAMVATWTHMHLYITLTHFHTHTYGVLCSYAPPHISCWLPFVRLVSLSPRHWLTHCSGNSASVHMPRQLSAMCVV